GGDDGPGAGGDLGPGPSCADGRRDGDETDVDCGGSCAPCALGRMCQRAAGCGGRRCVSGACGAPSTACNDEVIDGSGADVDCGGPQCPRCRDGRSCLGNNDCQNGNCSGGTCRAVMMGNCMDGIKNGMETDVDCGGGVCPACRDLQRCAQARDCVAFACQN